MFLAPLFLFGLAAAAIPLVLHLRRSTRVRKITFSTTRFFDEQFIRSSRRARFQDLLLMLLRVALLVLFVLALAQPLLKFPGMAVLAGGRRNVAIVLDDSASMGLINDKGTLLDRAKQGALALLDTLSVVRGDHVTLVLAGRREAGVKVVFPDPTKDFGAVRAAIAAVRVTDLGTDLNAAIAVAGHTLGADTARGKNPSGGSDREVYVFSDLQQSAFEPGQLVSAGPDVALLLVSTRADHALAKENVSVDAIQYGAPQPMIGVPFTFRSLLTNHSDAPRMVSAKLVIDGQTLSQKNVELAPGRSKIVRFTHRFGNPGWFRGYVEIGPPAPTTSGTDSTSGASGGSGGDSLAVDNRRYFALRVEKEVKLLAIDGAPSAVATNDELFFFRLALTVNPAAASPAGASKTPTMPSTPIQIDSGTPADLTPARLAGNLVAGPDGRPKMEPLPLVVLANVANLPPAALEALEHYVDGGGNLFITLGDRVDPKAYNTWIGDNRLYGGLLPGRLTRIIGDPRGAAVADADSSADDAAAPAGAPPAGNDAGFIATVADDHPALAGFADGQFGNLSSVHFAARYGLDAPADQVLMRAPNGDPLLAEKRFGRGRVMLFTSSIDRDWTNFPLQPAYVPWLYRLVGYLAQGTLEGAGFVRTGEVVAIPSSATQVEALQVECPDGTIAYPEPAHLRAVTGNSGQELTATEQAGIYAVRSAAQKGDRTPRLLLAANLPSEESDAHDLDEKALRPLIDPDTPWGYIDSPEAAVNAGELTRRGYGLWDQLLLAALIVALFEPWLANRLSKKRGQTATDAMRQRDVASPVKAAA